MSRTLLYSIVVVLLELARGSGQCSNQVLECQDYWCPVGRRNSCDFDSLSGRHVCRNVLCTKPNTDPCTCLANYRGCHIQQNASDAVGQPTYQGRPQTSYSCVNSTAGMDCSREVHVLGIYDGNGDKISWGLVLSAGNVTVDISLVGGSSSRPLVLALLSHYPMTWHLNIPSGTIIERVLLSSFHVDVSSVRYTPGSVLAVEKVSNYLLPSLADGFDGRGNHTAQALSYLIERFGSTASFTGAFMADRFRLTLRQTAQQSDCPMIPSQPPISSSPVVSSQCHPSGGSGACFLTSSAARCSADGYCRCPGSTNYDQCNCLARYGSCHVTKTPDGANSAGIPSYQGRTQITYSCTANDNCQNSVHIISVYEATRTGSFSVRPGSVRVRVEVSGEDSKPLILVLTSYYPIQWSLSLPQGVEFDRIIVSSYYRYLQRTSVSGAGSAVVERMNCSRTTRCYADGYDGDTVSQLRYVSNRFGPVASWSSAYRTDSWRLHIQRTSGCTSGPEVEADPQSCPVIQVPTAPPSSFNPPTDESIPSSPRPRPPGNTGSTSVVASTVPALLVLLITVIVPIGVCLFTLCSTTSRPQRHRRNQQPRYQHSTSTPQRQQANVELDPETFPGGFPGGVLAESAPPPYAAAVNFPSPTLGDKDGDVSQLKDPPPYPG